LSRRGWLATLALVALAHPASAQDPERWREPRRAHPGGARQPRFEALLAPRGEAGADAELDRFADEIARGLVREYGEAARDAGAPPADCRDPAEVALHQQALRSFARFADCMRWAEVCEAQGRAGPALAPVLSAAARCASADDQLARAHDWHERATRPENAGAEVHPGMVYVFARFAFLTQYQQEVPQILARNPDWAGSRLPVVQGALEYFLNGYTTLAPETAIRGEALRWMATGDAVLEQAATVDWGWDLLWNRGQERDSARFFAEKADRLTSPQEVWPTALAALYYAAQSDFAPSLRVYDAVLPYLNAVSPLPTQTNPYTYAELYARVCAAGLSAGTTAEAYRALQRDWLAGRMDAAQARDAALRLQSTAGERADLLTLLGGLAEDLGRDQEARDWYWRAHQACPYYNRAHDGLGNIRLRRMSRAWADYEATLARADDETRAAAFSPDVRHFVGNWASLRDETRKQVLHGLRLWAPYLDRLRDGGALVYFKRAPERVSDIEGFEPFRDIRYPDGRLYDDIGGLAYGSLSVIHLAAAAESPFIGGDITAHEVAHVFHDQLSPPLQGCIAQLYARALGRGLFPDPYAATNEFEYFAVGAEVFLTPADAAPRFGVNQGWLERNDAGLFDLLQQIATGREPSTLSCPVR
jgi:hypothetical protein